jgi:cobyrinic acid a,c-diamide synthase
MAELAARHLDLDAVLAAAAHVAPAGSAWDAGVEVGAPVPGRPVVAVAGGSAFTFGYAEHAELLAAAGADVAVFDPLRDEALPPGTTGLVLPGGFPEEHGGALAANAALRARVAEFAATGAPIHAECGGLLYLAQDLDGHPMCGVLESSGVMTPRLKLGYRDAVALGQSALFEEGRRITGHEFHRTAMSPQAGPSPAWRWSIDGDPAPPEGFVQGGLHASYLHVHPAGCPDAVARFVARCAAHRAPVASGR